MQNTDEEGNEELAAEDEEEEKLKKAKKRRKTEKVKETRQKGSKMLRKQAKRSEGPLKLIYHGNSYLFSITN